MQIMRKKNSIRLGTLCREEFTISNHASINPARLDIISAIEEYKKKIIILRNFDR